MCVGASVFLTCIDYINTWCNINTPLHDAMHNTNTVCEMVAGQENCASNFMNGHLMDLTTHEAATRRCAYSVNAKMFATFAK